MSPLFKLLLKRSNKNYINLKNEPTISRKRNIRERENAISVSKKSTQLELEKFKFTLPRKNILVKSPSRNNITKEVNKQTQ